MDLAELKARMAAGQAPDFLFFWGHRPAKDGRVAKSCFSQWWPAPFTHEGRTYATAEHWMMAKKAELFGDHDAAAAIVAAPTPKDAKRLGRGVRGYDDGAWVAARFGLVVEGNRLKFAQHPELLAFLRATGDRVLVEAAPDDAVWGIGLAEDHPDAPHPDRWPGTNLLGFALMRVRDGGA